VLLTTNPGYKAIVLAAAITSLAAGAGLNRMRGPLIAIAVLAAFTALLNFVSAHLGADVLFSLPAAIRGLGGPYTVEALAYGLTGGLTIGTAVLAAAPFSMMLSAHDVVDALPRALSRTGSAVAASLNLVPSIGATYVQVSEAQRMRGWRPRGPRSWAEVVVPVVLTSVEASIQLAESMEARGFGSGPRTVFAPHHMGAADWAVVAASAGAVALFVLASIAGWAAPWAPYPTLSPPSVDPRPALACLLLFLPAVVWRSRR
jgi:energy-coupling factor transport system permease protein